MLLAKILKRAAKLYPQNIGIICGEKSYTYGELAQRVNRLASVFSHLGIKRGDKIAILHPNCHYFLETYFATALLGVVLTPLNYRLSPKELAFIINDSESRILIAKMDFQPQVEDMEEDIRGVKEIIWTGNKASSLSQGGDKNYEQLLNQVKEDFGEETEGKEEDPAQLYYTSGTTGRPKGVILTHKNVYLHALNAIAEFNLKETDRWIHVAPLFHLADGWATWAITWVGGRHVMVKEFEPQMVLETIQKEKITITNLIPTMLNLLVNYPEVNKYDFRSLRLLLSGGAPISLELVKKIIKIFSCDYAQTYGLTESSPYLTVSLLKEHLKRLPLEEQLRYRATTGREFLGVELKLVNEKGEEVARNNKEVGEIIAKGPTVTSGYWNLPEETERALKDGWLYTGDLGVIDQEGYITIVDRKKDMIISGGENIYSIEVENVLYTHPAILEVAVIGVPDPKWGEAVKAMVVLKEGTKAKEEELIKYCKERLSSYKAPKSIDFLPSLPKTGSGKINKKELKEKYWVGYEKRVH